MQQLTARQAQVLKMICDFIEYTGLPPTRAEVAKALGFRSINAAEEHIKVLAKKGAIELLPGASRGIRIIAANGIPVIGRVAGGPRELRRA